MRPRTTRPWQNYLLAIACVGAIVAAYELVGPTTPSSSTETRLVTVQRGVVQSSESESGNLAPASEADLNFKSSGILTGLYVQPGQHVHKGQLLAQIDPTSASVALQEAQASLQAAQAKLAATEANPSGSSSNGSAGTSASAAAAGGPTGDSGASSATGTTGTSGTSAQPTKQRSAASKTPSTTTSTDPALTRATDAANIASAQAAVSSAELTVKSDTAALAGTKLYAPSNGTIASISGAVGDEVTAGTGSSSANDGSSGTGASSALSSAASSSSTSSSSSGSGFIVLADLSSMQLVVSVSESDIGSIKVGQPATISVAALPSEEFAAKVTAISLLSSDSSGVVSYNVTIKLSQNSSRLRPGMTATATIVTGQANNAVNVESAAISSRGDGSTVTVDKNGKMIVTPVITGLVGTSSTQIVAGLSSGEEVAIPISTSIATSTATSSTGSGTLGSSGLGAGGFGGGGGGFARFARGG
ncbi:MAG TPA: efflux RND transporter periplasmic adaptor subunit [Solirubrobacteraceae bacterium]|nr:efflux RND transporter periplasmic adaptor subunit [Solirubrobacteraceae bacterium]